MIYIVQHGDTPARIAQRLTGNANAMGQLIAANPALPRAPFGVGGVGGVTFQGLAVGQRLNLPPAWNRFFGVGSSASDLQAAQAAEQVFIAAITAAGAQLSAGNYDAAVQAFQSAGNAATGAGGSGPLIDKAGQDVGVDTQPQTGQASTINGNLAKVTSSGSSAADASSAQSLAGNMRQLYDVALASVVSAQGGGGGGGGTNPYSAATISAAQAVTNLGSMLCNLGGSKTGNATVLAFQQAYNATPGVPSLTTDGKYGPQTQSALANVLTYGGGGVAPPACTSYTNPPGSPTSGGGCPAGQATDVDTGACVPLCPDGSAQVGGVCGGGAVTAPVQAGNGALAAGIALVVLGAGAVGYAVTKKKGRGRRAARRR